MLSEPEQTYKMLTRHTGRKCRSTDKDRDVIN